MFRLAACYRRAGHSVSAGLTCQDALLQATQCISCACCNGAWACFATSGALRSPQLM